MNRIAYFLLHCTSTEELRNFWPSYRRWSRYHIIVPQAHTGIQVVLHKIRNVSSKLCVENQEKHFLFNYSR